MSAPGFVFKPFRHPLKEGTGSDAMSELPPAYKPKYPFNNVTCTESGHQIELDDTPGAERICITHRAGSQIEMQPDGTVKVKSTKTRQDVTIGDHEVMVMGDYKITTQGKCVVYAQGGELVLQSDRGIAIAAEGELKLTGDNVYIRSRGMGKITLDSTFIDIGPYLTLPGGVAITMGGVIVPRLVTGGASAPPMDLSGVTKAAALLGITSTASNTTSNTNSSFNQQRERDPRERGGDDDGTPIESPPSPPSPPSPTPPSPTPGGPPPLPSIATIVEALTGVIKSVLAISIRIQLVAAYSQLAVGVALAKTLVNSRGEKLIPELSNQPEELPLTSPRTYQGKDDNKIKFRDRQFDSPDDVNDSTTYTAHLLLCEKLEDFSGDEKNLPGEIFNSDETKPADEPQPFWSFPLDDGLVSCVQNEKQIIGTNTKFTEELVVGQRLRIENRPVIIESIQSDTVLFLKNPWPSSSVSNVVAQVYRFRSFRDFSGIFEYGYDYELGASEITLEKLMKNFIMPVIEPPPTPLTATAPPATGVTVTPSPAPPTPSPTPGTPGEPPPAYDPIPA